MNEAVPKSTFIDGVYSLDELSLPYKLFVPERASGNPAPLLLMLHGCGQNAEDFSTGTRMNAIAQAAGMYVLYPTQPSSANANKCWNWFVPLHQVRDSGEPAALSALTRTIMGSHAIDPQQVFVAGLSAGGAMAIILAEQYPELFTAVGVHSGLPSGAATSMMEAFSLMQNATPVQPEPVTSGPDSEKHHHTPMIVFHGDQDRTVHCANAERIIWNWLEREAARTGTLDWQPTSLTHVSDAGRQSIVTTYESGALPGRTGCEYWQLIDAGHTWSGGSANGSYTDTQGPNASEQMVRFFLGKAA